MITLSLADVSGIACVADWSQAGIDYTESAFCLSTLSVADWSQAGIDYTLISVSQLQSGVADWSQAGIDYTAKLAKY